MISDTLGSMAFDLGFVVLERIVVHELPEDEDPVLSETLEDPGPEPKNFFRERMVNSLTTAGRSIRFNPQSDSKIPDLVRKLLKDGKSLLTGSQECARILAERQKTGNISPGLLCVVDGKHQSKRVAGIVKLEMEHGVQLHRGNLGGKRSLSMRKVNDLMLAGSTRIFKVALFYAHGKSVHGMLSDHQISRTSVRGGAQFFLEDFLGCELEELADVTTSRYFETVTKFINDLTDSEKQYRYDTALHADLMSNEPNVQPTVFARKHVDPADRASLFSRLTTAEIPQANFQKDTTRIDTHLKKRRLETMSGLILQGPVTSFNDHVEMGKDGDKITINDRVTKLGHRL